MSPGFCRTPMTADMIKGVEDSPLFSYSGYSGALRIYQTAIDQEATSEIFYHRGRPNNYN